MVSAKPCKYPSHTKMPSENGTFIEMDTEFYPGGSSYQENMVGLFGSECI
jgi:hypothetical protein